MPDAQSGIVHILVDAMGRPYFWPIGPGARRESSHHAHGAADEIRADHQRGNGASRIDDIVVELHLQRSAPTGSSATINSAADDSAPWTKTVDESCR